MSRRVLASRRSRVTLIYPDSHDLINLCRGTGAKTIANLGRNLSEHSAQFVYSFDTLIEISAPLRDGQILEVRRDLSRLDELPHLFANEAAIHDQEIREAVNAFNKRREYNFSAVKPFAKRLDEAIEVRGAPLYVIDPQMGRVPTKMIVDLRIAAVILHCFDTNPETFNVQHRREPEWIRLMADDRAMENPPKLADHFVAVIGRDLAMRKIPPPAADLESFARWVYEAPTRCPGVRLITKPIIGFVGIRLLGRKLPTSST